MLMSFLLLQKMLMLKDDSRATKKTTSEVFAWFNLCHLSLKNNINATNLFLIMIELACTLTRKYTFYIFTINPTKNIATLWCTYFVGA